MNESDPFNCNSMNNICRVCLKSTNDLNPMLKDHIASYRNIVDEVALEEYDMKLCTICRWMFIKFSKFKWQCKSANDLLKEVFMNSKSLSFLENLTISHNFTKTCLETYQFNPFNHTNDSDHINIDISCSDKRDSDKKYSDKKYNENKYSDHKNSDTTIDVFVGRFRSNYSIHDNYDIASDSKDDINDSEIQYNDVNIESDHDEDDDMPLQILRNNNSKRKSKKKKHKNHKKEVEASKREDSLSKSKKKKELRDGFTSRMVQETDEYVVIKLTKEQVMQEMEERAKSESYLRLPFRCEKCVKGFNFKDVMETHLEKHSMKNGSFGCEMCGQYCRSAVSLRGHIKSHTTRYKCKLCGHIRLSRQHLLEHHTLSHTSAPRPPAYNCDFCNFTSNKRTVMQRHVRRHAAGESHACHLCGKLFKSIESLRVHTVRHDKSSRFKCDQCDATFLYQSLLSKHVQCVHERREYYCVECDVQFKTAESLRLHFKKAKRHRDASSYKDSLRVRSWRVKTQKGRLACAHCGNTFARKSTLNVHMRTHTDANLHVCECGASFTQDNTLLAHILAKHKKEEVVQYDSKVEL